VDLKKQLRHVMNFPREGIDYIDITPVLQDLSAFEYIVNCFVNELKNVDFDLIVCLESRGFLFGAPVAYALNKGLVPIRKYGKLPHDTIQEKYSLEYGDNVLEIHIDAIKKGQKVIIIDDILATGGTVSAGIKLIERLGGVVSKILFLAELEGLSSTDIRNTYDVFSIVTI